MEEQKPAAAGRAQQPAQQQAGQTTEKGENRRLALSCFDWMSSLITALLVVACVFVFLFRIVGVSGQSMTNTLQNGDRLIMISRFYTIERGDIVVINRRSGEPLIKRVIAVAGDTIAFNDETGKITLNGVEQDEPYVRRSHTGSFGFETPYTVPEGYIFAMGDNRDESKDSRMLGPFAVRYIAGVAVFRLFPLSEFGRIGHEGE